MISNDFCDNVCHLIVAEASDRLEVLRFESENKQVKDFLTQSFTGLHIDDLQGEIHYDSLRDGNSTLAITWNNETLSLELIQEPWWDGSYGIWIYYENDKAQFAVKEWRLDNQTIRRTIYYDDRIERYSSVGLS